MLHGINFFKYGVKARIDPDLKSETLTKSDVELLIKWLKEGKFIQMCFGNMNPLGLFLAFTINFAL